MKMHVVAAALLGMLIATVAAAQNPRSAAAAANASQSMDSRTAAALITRYRAANGLGPVAPDGRLAAAAEQQARMIARSGMLDHGDFAGRMAAFGIRGKAAENLALGVDSVVQAIALWQGSSGHNANLLTADFTRIGLGKVDSGRRYWALVLAR